MSNRTLATLGLIAAAALGVYLVARRFNLTADSFNIASPGNVAYSGANAVVQAITGDANQTFGGAIFDLFNPDAGMGAGETSPGRGLIASPAVPVRTVPYSGALAFDDSWYFGMGASGAYAVTDGGAVTGRTIKP